MQIHSKLVDVFALVSTPSGLEKWWALKASGKPLPGEEYQLNFGEGYDWTARVTRIELNSSFELEMRSADADWVNTRVGFSVQESTQATQLEFYHSGWPQINDHYKISAFCWAMYLRLLKRFAEHGEFVPYHERLEA